MKKLAGGKLAGAEGKKEVSESDAQLEIAHPYLKHYVEELRQEIARLQRKNAQQDVAHLSAIEALKATYERKLIEMTIRAKNLSPAEAYELMLGPNTAKRP